MNFTSIPAHQMAVALSASLAIENRKSNVPTRKKKFWLPNLAGSVARVDTTDVSPHWSFIIYSKKSLRFQDAIFCQ